MAVNRTTIQNARDLKSELLPKNWTGGISGFLSLPSLHKEVWYAFEYEEDVRRGLQGHQGRLQRQRRQGGNETVRRPVGRRDQRPRRLHAEV